MRAFSNVLFQQLDSSGWQYVFAWSKINKQINTNMDSLHMYVYIDATTGVYSNCNRTAIKKMKVYLLFKYILNNCLEFLRVVEVYCYDVGFADVLFSVWMLRWHLLRRRKHECYLSWVHYIHYFARVHFHSSQLWRSEERDYTNSRVAT